MSSGLRLDGPWPGRALRRFSAGRFIQVSEVVLGLALVEIGLAVEEVTLDGIEGAADAARCLPGCDAARSLSLLSGEPAGLRQERSCRHFRRGPGPCPTAGPGEPVRGWPLPASLASSRPPTEAWAQSSFCASATRPGSSATERPPDGVLQRACRRARRGRNRKRAGHSAGVAWLRRGRRGLSTGEPRGFGARPCKSASALEPASIGSADSGGPTGVVAFSSRPSSAIKTGSSWTDTPLPGVLAAADRCEGVTESVPVTLALRSPSPERQRATATAGSRNRRGGLERVRPRGDGRDCLGGVVASVRRVRRKQSVLSTGGVARQARLPSASKLASDASPGSISTEMPPPAFCGSAVGRR